MESSDSIDSGSFVLSHPELQPGLTEVIEAGSQPIHYINRYHADHDVPCAFCAKQTPHRRGFTAQMPDGRIALIGRDCAKEFFGKERAGSWEKALKAQEDRRAQLIVLEKTASNIHLLIAAISPDLVKTEARFLAITLEISQRMKGRAPQVRRRDNGDWDVIDRIGNVHFTILGAAILNGGAKRRHHLARAREALMQLAGVQPDLDWSDTRIRRLLEVRRTAIADVEAGLRFLGSCRRFYSEGNLKGFTRLLQDMGAALTRVDLKRKKSASIVRLSDRGMRILGIDDADGIYLREPAKVNFEVPDLTDLPSPDALMAGLR